MTVLIKGGLVVDPKNNINDVMDILIQNDRIVKVEKNIICDADEILDASNLCVMPGFIDMHIHLRDPGFTYKEDIITGCNSACSGGVTSVLCMPNTNPAIDNKETVEYIKEKSKNANAKVYITGSISKKLHGDEMCDFEELKKAGVIALSDDGRPVKNAKMMMDALVKANQLGLLVTSHCEDLDIIDGGIINDGKVSKELGVKGMHRSSEDYITAREIILAETNNLKVHIAHVSTKLSTQLIREAKKRGVKVTAETCPHYFSLTEKETLSKDADYRMNPPLREDEDVKAILNGVLDGTIDCIVTDHAPHSSEEKSDFYKAPNGVIGMETSFSASYTYLVKTNKMTISDLVKVMSVNPAKILGIEGGDLSVGSVADIAIADLNEQWVVDINKLHSKAKNAIYKNKTLTGKIKYTYLNGKRVFEDVK